MEIGTAATDLLTGSASAGATSSQSGASAVEREKVKQFARDFEALLVTQMLKEMRRSMLTDEESEPGLGAATMTDAIDSQLGIALTQSGGLGLAAVMLRALDRQQGIAPAGETAAPITIDATLATDTASASESDLTHPQGAVTSAFGWRADPLTGQTRFHSGTDIRMAYGQDVRAAAGGRVVFAGEQSGYGETLVIDHGNGVETRYGHLSASMVQAGDLVDSGQVVARSGNSGRSTGPHLHFEVLKQGRAVDPAVLSKEFAVKGLLAAADSTTDK